MSANFIGAGNQREPHSAAGCPVLSCQNTGCCKSWPNILKQNWSRLKQKLIVYVFWQDKTGYPAALCISFHSRQRNLNNIHQKNTSPHQFKIKIKMTTRYIKGLS